MSITITKQTSTNKTNYCPGRDIEYIVIHYTAGSTSKRGTAINTANYWATGPTEGSADFVVDDELTVQYNPDLENRLCWHCGDTKWNTPGGSFYGKCTNANSIGIEICCTNTNYSPNDPANSSKWYFTEKVLSRAIELTKYLMQKYGIGIDHVIRHYDVSGKPCPGIRGWNTYNGSTEEKWLDFKKRLGGTTTSPATNAVPTSVKTNTKVNTPIYRVRKSANDSKTQIGAYSVLDNAKKQADAHAGYSVYDMNGKLVYSPTSKKKTVTELAREVINGKWGNGADRKNRLTAAGYDYTAVQAEVNKLLS